MAAANHYELLQIAPDASQQELRQAFRRLSKRYHPDTTDLPAEQAEEAFRHLQQAYLTLSDPERRRVYDVSLRPVAQPLQPLRVPVVKPVPVRRALSGGEWFALLLLGVAVVFSLVLGVGLAWARGTELLREPSWWPGSEQTAQTLPSTAPDVVSAAPQAPLYNHPLPALEQWLRDLGAVQHAPHSCVWDLQLGGWSAQIELEVEELSIRWQSGDTPVERHFPYGFSRADVEAAILAGPLTTPAIAVSMGARLRRPMDSTSTRQPQVSNRFLQPEQLAAPKAGRAWSPTEVFAEGQWQSVRVQLEARGWNSLQIEQIHDQLRQGWPLAMAENNVAVISGHCPIKARRIH